jgi:hypothetical protein
VQVFGATIASCAKPVAPVLRANYYNTSGGVVNRQLSEPESGSAGAALSFKFRVPRLTQEVTWQLSLGFYCGEDGQSDTRSGIRLAGYTAGVLDWLQRKWDCLMGICPRGPPPPPPPPKPCEACTPVKPPQRPKPPKLGPKEDNYIDAVPPRTAYLGRRTN